MADSEQVNVLLYGLGAIGSFYAFILHRCDRVKLTVVARSNYDAVVKNVPLFYSTALQRIPINESQGITIDSKNHGKHTFRPDRVDALQHPQKARANTDVRAVLRTPSESSSHYDYIVCAHKAIDPHGAILPLDPAISEKSTIVILQNGVGNEDPFRERWAGVTIISGVVWVGASQPSPGVVVHTGSEHTELGLFANGTLDRALEESRLNAFASLLTAGGTHLSVFEDIQPRRWEKVIWNVAWNAITTLTDQDVNCWLASSPDAIPYTRRLMGEVIAVARACGVHVKDGLADGLIAKARGLGELRTSMQADREAGREMEIEVILGVPVKRGRELGVDTPCLEGLYVLLRAVNGRIQRAEGGK
ncbi:ketopantoate reductase family protein [Aspergillus mulundensis]|uniref:2-dehydropantoate 2-reductase n=1 Tax=Aspergillus mulundensis TaxID=1810919 RepID=A0A3D8RY52_9EURO|nr:2-dehydropantoate 2-reductase [Aspergillus mulundensis]RDW78946.1 2-dehydropantoate 2-reductase [Aspergillus mulundensis]